MKKKVIWCPHGERDKETRVRKGCQKTAKGLKDEEFPAEYKRALSITVKILGLYLTKNTASALPISVRVI